jgi:hypothetical protein
MVTVKNSTKRQAACFPAPAMSAGSAGRSGQAQTYHAKEFTSAEQNYWQQGDTVVGEWQGKMAERYGLAGAIDAQHFARLSTSSLMERSMNCNLDLKRSTLFPHYPDERCAAMNPLAHTRIPRSHVGR